MNSSPTLEVGDELLEKDKFLSKNFFLENGVQYIYKLYDKIKYILYFVCRWLDGSD